MPERITLSRAKGWRMPPCACRSACYNHPHGRRVLGIGEAARATPLPFVRAGCNRASVTSLWRAQALNLPQTSAGAEQPLTSRGAPRRPAGRHGQAIWVARGEEGADEARISEASPRHHRPDGRCLHGLWSCRSPRPSGSSSRGRRRRRTRDEGLALSSRHGLDVCQSASRTLSAPVRQLPSGGPL